MLPDTHPTTAQVSPDGDIVYTCPTCGYQVMMAPGELRVIEWGDGDAKHYGGYLEA